MGEGAEGIKGGGKVMGKEAAAAHARIEGDVDGEGLVEAGVPGEVAEVFGFLEGGEAGGPAPGDDFGAFARGGGAEEIDAGGDADIGELPGFGGAGDAEEGRGGVAGEDGGDFGGAMAVGVGFDHGDQYAAGFRGSRGSR